MVMDSSSNIRVVVRVRPPNTKELEQNQRTIIKCDSQQSLTFDPDEDEDEFFFHGAKQFHRDITRKQNKKLLMEFDQIFDDSTVNMNVFESSMKPLVQSVMDGFNCSAFVYGATGAGKTYTMLGCPSQPGITYLTMEYLFEKIAELSDERKFDIGISYLEVYNENVMNLLTKSGPLKLREDSNGVVVGGLRLLPIRSATELLNLLALGNQNRTQHPTDANAESSRSHAIFQVHIRMIHKKSGQKNTVKLSMIDLAGSERAASTKGIGMRFKEGASINKSLLALGNCINKLADGAKHIPYRDSNLTRIIKDSLGGNCRTVMIANVSPSSLTYEDTYNTLKYASRAKKIRSSARLNICKVNTPKEVLVKQMNEQHTELLVLREKVRMLESSLAASQAPLSPIKKVDQLMDELKPWYDQIDKHFERMNQLMQRSLEVDSVEKVHQFHRQIKQYVSEATQQLVLDDARASVDRGADLGEIMFESQKQEVKQCRQLMSQQKVELGKLKTAYASNCYAPIINEYLRGRERESEAMKNSLKVQHILKINQVYHVEVQYFLRLIKLSGSIIQENFYTLRANDLLDINMRSNLEQLKRYATVKRDNGLAENMLGEVVSKDDQTMDQFNITIFGQGAAPEDHEHIDEGMHDGDDPDDNEWSDDPSPERPKRPLTAGTATVTKKQAYRSDIVARPPINSRPGPLEAAAAKLSGRSFTISSSKSARSHMDVDVHQPSAKPVKSMHLVGKTKKDIALHNILTVKTTNPLFNKVSKVPPKTPTARVLSINKENKRLSPIRRSPRTRSPRQNNASRFRQRAQTSTNEPAVKKKPFNVFPTK